MDRTTRNLLIALAAVVGVVLLFSALAGAMMGPALGERGFFGPDLMRGHAWMWGLGMGFGGLTMVLFWAVLLVGLVLLARSVGMSAGIGQRPSESTPLDVLKHRYASGQITREQFEQMRKDLEG
jgi:putative membrane protein